MHRYSASGTVPIVGGLMTVAASLVTAAVLGFVCAIVIRWSPLVYLNILATLGFGFAMGMVVDALSTRGKIRSPLFVRGTWLLTLLFGYYIYWGATIWAHGNWGGGMLVFEPGEIKAFAEKLFVVGSWAFRKGGNVTGWFLVAVWVLEFGMIAYFSYITAVGNIDLPFCEACQEWTGTEKGVALYQATGREPEWDNVRLGEFQALLQVPLLSSSLSEYIRLDVNACPQCPNSNFLSIRKVKTTIDKDGDETTKESPLIANMTLTGEQLAQVRTLVDQSADAAAEAAAARALEREEAQRAAGIDPNEMPKIKVD